MKPIQQNVINIPKEKLRYEDQDLIYFIEKSSGVYLHNIIIIANQCMGQFPKMSPFEIARL